MPLPLSVRSTRLMTGERDPSTLPYLLCSTRYEACALSSLCCEETWTMKPPPLLAGAICVGLVAAIRCGGSAAGADCGASDIGWLALALAEVGGLRGAAGVAG